MRIMPWDSNYTEISPTEFEHLVHSHVVRLGKNLKIFKAEHNDKLEATDGVYQIDVTAQFEAFGVEFLVLIECKHHKHPIKREVVQLLYDKIRAIGAHKGIIFASVGFQKGAIEYAKAHGIALIRVVEGKLTYEVKSNVGPVEPPPWVNLSKYVVQYIEQKDKDGIGVADISNGDIGPLENFLFH
jgi:restriction system protein